MQNLGINLLDGTRYSYDNPCESKYPIEEIARGLSHVPRFGGHTRHFYSVAQHCYNGTFLLSDPKDQYDFLFHDAHEGLLGFDAPTPMKVKIPELRTMGDEADVALSAQFGFRYPYSDAVKKVDTDMLILENYYLRNNQKLIMFDVDAYDISDGHALVEAGQIVLDLLSHEHARGLWLSRYEELKDAIA